MHTSIEYAASCPDDEVMFMGEETYEPGPGATHAGKTSAAVLLTCTGCAGSPRNGTLILAGDEHIICVEPD